MMDRKYDANNNYDSQCKDSPSSDRSTSSVADIYSSEDEISDSESLIYDRTGVSKDEISVDVNEETMRESGAEKVSDDSKPTQSYIALIAMAILSSPERKMVLSDIYTHILDNYPFYKTQDKSWRNSIRHNLSLNECFVKAGRSENGKGNYWAIHPSNEEDFAKGDYRRRRTRRKSKRAMIHPYGLYSEFFRPFHALPLTYQSSRRTMPHLWNLRAQMCSAKVVDTYEIPNTFMKQNIEPKPKKLFTIDSILGNDNQKKETEHEDHLRESNDRIQRTDIRRHHSWSTTPHSQPESPRYDGSAFSPVYSRFPIEPCSPFQVLPDIYRRFDRVPMAGYYTKDNIRELGKLRKSFS